MTKAEKKHDSWRYMRIAEVMDATSLSRSEIYKRIKKNRFPRQVKLGKQAVAWMSSAVEDWMTRPVDYVAS